MYNYGQLQVMFEDGSVGWYEAGWGPMMSEMAFFVKDVVGPKGCVSIVRTRTRARRRLRRHRLATPRPTACACTTRDLDADDEFVKPDELIEHRGRARPRRLCAREQAYLLRAIREDLDLSDHMADAVNSLRIVLAADESFRTGQVVVL